MQYPMTFEQMADALRGSGQFRVLTKFTGQFNLAPARAGQARKVAVILDTETTGKDRPPGKAKNGETDKIIELGMLKFAFDPESGDILEILGQYSAFEDPGMPIPSEATAINGITNEMVAGQRFDDQAVEQFIADAELIVAHNARFDRPYVEQRFAAFKRKNWACTMSQIDWQAETITSAKLEYIASVLGFYFEAHRALNDCEAVLHMLQHVGPQTMEPFMLQLERAAYSPIYRVWADGALFEMKDVLKENGFYWFEQGNFIDGVFKAWYIEVPEDKLEEQFTWLRTHVYFGKSVNITVQEITADARFSRRVSRIYAKTL